LENIKVVWWPAPLLLEQLWPAMQSRKRSAQVLALVALLAVAASATERAHVQLRGVVAAAPSPAPAPAPEPIECQKMMKAAAKLEKHQGDDGFMKKYYIKEKLEKACEEVKAKAASKKAEKATDKSWDHHEDVFHDDKDPKSLVHLHGVVAAAPSPAPAAPGAPEPKECLEQKKLEAELGEMEGGEKGFMEKYNEAEEAEQKCEDVKADAAREKAEKATEKSWDHHEEVFPDHEDHEDEKKK